MHFPDNPFFLEVSTAVWNLSKFKESCRIETSSCVCYNENGSKMSNDEVLKIGCLIV